MRTSLAPAAKAGRNELVALAVPRGSRPLLPPAAPAASIWKSDFAEEPGEQLLLRGPKGERWLLLRVPRASERTPEDVRNAAGRARSSAEKLKRSSLTLDLSLLKPGPAEIQGAVEAAVMAGYDPAVLKKERRKFLVKRVVVAGAGNSARAREAVRLGKIAGEANLFTRDLQNLPSNVIFPRALASRARKVAASSPRLRVKVLGRKGMEALKMGCLLGVAKGSSQEPQLIHLTYRPSGRKRGRIALVGKGLCFDSGGISLKPSSKMDEMKFDMSGAAAVLGVFQGLAAGHPCPYEVHGVLGCAMNMPGGRAQVPGDIVTAMNGRTIEVLNTDAEGRLVLADALTYAVRKTRPDRIYDLATLTGAAIVSLGHHATAILGNKESLRDALQDAGERAGERCWPLPLWEVHRDLTHGRYADLKNIYSPGDGAGTIAGAAFLSHFVDDCPWVHLDIAGTAWGGPEDAYHGAGGRGVGVRLLLELLRS